MGYGDEQIRDLVASVAAVPADIVVDGSPANLSRVLEFDKPVVSVRYELDAESAVQLVAAIENIGGALE